MQEREFYINGNFLEQIEPHLTSKSLSDDLRSYLVELRHYIVGLSAENYNNYKRDCVSIKEENVPLSSGVFLEELDQILGAKSGDRAMYYLKRLYKGLSSPAKTKKHNEINMNRWKEYNDIKTDSLWLLERDNDSLHDASYHGNFVPEIPRQMIKRYTKVGGRVLENFAGYGTTLIEAIKLKREWVGIDLNEKCIERSNDIIRQMKPSYPAEIIFGDALTVDYSKLVENKEKFDLCILHPPYHDIIKFTDKAEDLSNMSLFDFSRAFSNLISKIYPVLQEGGFLVLVIGDKYQNGEVIPMGFDLMRATLDAHHAFFKLKSVIVKDFGRTKAKRDKEDLWKFRALNGDFCTFNHEYIFVFQSL